jgi:hypothetical protein
MSDAHKAALAKGRDEGRIVRRYLSDHLLVRRALQLNIDVRMCFIEFIDDRNVHIPLRLEHFELAIGNDKRLAAWLERRLRFSGNSRGRCYFHR